MATRQPNIPDLSDTSPSALIRWARQIKLALGILSNDIPTTDKSALDVAVRFRDLIDAGIAIEAPKGSKYVVLPADGSKSNYAAPPAPVGFTVVRMPFNIRLSWTEPTYRNHDHTEVWRAFSNNLTAAVKIADIAEGTNLYEDGHITASFYWIRFVSKSKIVGAFNAISGTSHDKQPGDVTGLTFEFEGFGVRFRWNPVVDQDLASYELRLGSTWEAGTPLEGGASGRGTDVGGTSYLWKIQVAGTYRVWVRARDVMGFYSGTAASVDVTIAAPAAIVFAPGLPVVGDSLSLSWQAVAGTFALDLYEIRTGSTWATSTLLDRAYVTIYFQKIDWGGTRRFWVSARDVAGNYGSPVPIDIVINPPGQVGSLRSEVVDNNVLLFWTPVTGTLPILTYEIYRGDTFAGATLIGDKAGLFTSIFEQTSGNHTYWVRARDTAGNLGPERSVTSFVNQPPDFVLYSDQNPPLSGTSLVNAFLDATGVIVPINPTETWDNHYASRGWNTDQDAINAGFPIYAQPVPTTGSIQLSIDYGVNVPPTGVQISATLAVIAGAPTNSIQIDHKLNLADPWTPLPVGAQGYISVPFRYLRVTLTATTSGSGVGFYRCTNINVRLNVKQKTFAGQGTIPANATTGRVFHLTNDGLAFNPPNNHLLFIDLFGPPAVQPQGTVAIIPVVEFVDVPNPQTFTVRVFDANGVIMTTPVDISWSARGV